MTGSRRKLKRRTTLLMSDELFDAIDALAAECGCRRNELLVGAIADTVARRECAEWFSHRDIINALNDSSRVKGSR